jgi:hypothetical protein
VSNEEHNLHFGVETTDVPPRYPIVFGVGALLLVGAAILLTLFLVHNPWVQPEVPTPSVLSPAPQAPFHVEADPKNRLIEVNARAEQRLKTYGWVDREAGIVHIPIERAMELTVQERGGGRPPAGQGGGS